MRLPRIGSKEDKMNKLTALFEKDLFTAGVLKYGKQKTWVRPSIPKQAHQQGRIPRPTSSKNLVTSLSTQ